MCRRTRCGEREQRARAGARWTAGAYGVTPRGHHHRPHRHATPETVLAAAAKRRNARTDLGIRSRLRRHLMPGALDEASAPARDGPYPEVRLRMRERITALSLARARAPPAFAAAACRHRGGPVERTRQGKPRSLRRAAPGFLKDGEPIIRSALDPHERFRVAARTDCGVACGGRPPHRTIAYAWRRLSRSCRGWRAHGGARGRSGVQDQRRGSRSDGG